MNAVVKAEAPQFTPVLYDRMTQAIAECERLDEVKDWHDKAAALHEYARQARNTEAAEIVERIRVRAQRRYGELLIEMKERGEIATGAKGVGPIAVERNDRNGKTLSELGVTKDFSAKSQKLAQIPPAQFEEALSQPKPSVSKILKDTDPDRNAKPKKKMADVVYMQTRLTAQAKAENYRQSGATRPKSTLWQ